MAKKVRYQRKGAMIQKARPIDNLVEYMEIEKDNLDEVAEWCKGMVAANQFVEYYSKLYGHWSKASVGQFLVKESDNPVHYRPYSEQEFKAHFEDVSDAPTDSK